MTEKYAGFWVRAAARLVDLAIVGVISVIVYLFSSAVELLMPFDGSHIFFNIGLSDIMVYCLIIVFCSAYTA